MISKETPSGQRKGNLLESDKTCAKELFILSNSEQSTSKTASSELMKESP